MAGGAANKGGNNLSARKWTEAKFQYRPLEGWGAKFQCTEIKKNVVRELVGGANFECTRFSDLHCPTPLPEIMTAP